MDSIYAYGLFENGQVNLKKREVKQIFINFISYFILKHKSNDPLIKDVFVIFPNIVEGELEYIDLEALRKFLKPQLRSLRGLCPDRIFLGKREALLTNPDLIQEVFYKINRF
jgi:hypothetical protein